MFGHVVWIPFSRECITQTVICTHARAQTHTQLSLLRNSFFQSIHLFDCFNCLFFYGIMSTIFLSFVSNTADNIISFECWMFCLGFVVRYIWCFPFVKLILLSHLFGHLKHLSENALHKDEGAFSYHHVHWGVYIWWDNEQIYG